MFTTVKTMHDKGRYSRQRQDADKRLIGILLDALVHADTLLKGGPNPFKSKVVDAAIRAGHTRSGVAKRGLRRTK